VIAHRAADREREGPSRERVSEPWNRAAETIHSSPTASVGDE
jgi:hypothetical protein